MDALTLNISAPGHDAPSVGTAVTGEGAARAVRTSLDEDIAGLNLDPVSFLAVRTHGWDLKTVDAIEMEYRCFLQCVRDFPEEVIVPPMDVDLYWHCHILSLGMYLEQTTRLFGHPLLHWPYSGVMGEADAARQAARFEHSRPILADLTERILRGIRSSTQDGEMTDER
jgi:hypothetical protein